MRTAAGVLAAVAVAHAGPAVAAIGPVRRRLMPALSGSGSPRPVALPFDDGPHPQATPALLRLLDNAGVRATFFLLGRMAEEHPQVARAIADQGHEIAVHGYEHRLLLKRRPADTFADRTASPLLQELEGCGPAGAATGPRRPHRTRCSGPYAAA